MGKKNSPERKKFEFLQVVENTIVTFDMFQKKDTVLVGVSGGPDSVALLLVLLGLRDRLFIEKLGVAHLNHCLRKEASENDAIFVKDLAKKLNLPFFSAREDVEKYKKKHRLSLEEAARQVRYAFLNEIAEKENFNRIAIGHNSDENAELVLMQLLRGSGTLGMAGIPPVRNIIVRPLINVSKVNILEYLKKKEQQYTIDKSNEDDTFLRNRVRKNLIPELKETYNPNIVETINRLSSILRCEEEWLENIIAPLLSESVEFRENGRIVVNAEKINSLHIAEKRRVIRLAIKEVKGDLRQMTLFHVDAVIGLLEKGTDYRSLDFPGRIRVSRFENKLMITRENQNLRSLGPASIPHDNEKPTFEYIIDESEVHNMRLFIEESNFYLEFTKTNMKYISDLRDSEKKVAYMDLHKIRFPITVRNVMSGDRFSPFGMKGTQKIAKYLTNNKILKPERDKSAVIVSDQKIVWVVGHRIDDAVKLSPQTKMVLVIEMVFS